jgi:thiamine-monophosphate kinase
MPPLTERQLVRLLAERFRATSPQVRLGIGDDAAVLASRGDDWVCSVDSSVDGVHFDLAYLALNDVGYRSFQAAASDLAAMGAAPVAALSALILPPSLSPRDIDDLTRGQALASQQCGCPIVGGNISRGRELSITTTVIGTAAEPLRRDGARPGQELWLVGAIGLAAAGLSALRLGRFGSGDATGPLDECAARWRRPQALIARGSELVGRASAAIDVSDGLAADAGQLARASGVCVLIEAGRLRAALGPRLIEASRALRRSPLRFALFGGEDYALLATGPRSRRPAWAKAIGHVLAGSGVRLQDARGSRLLTGGYDHLARARGVPEPSRLSSLAVCG